MNTGEARFVFITSSAASIPRYVNFTFHRLGVAANTCPRWTTLFVERRIPLGKASDVLNVSHGVVITSELMNLFPGTFNAIAERCFTQGDRLKRILFLSDVNEKTLSKATGFRPHEIISLAGYLLPSYPAKPQVYVPHCGLILPHEAAPIERVFVPEIHFATGKPNAHQQQFYATRIQTSKTLLGHPMVEFQRGQITGDEFYKKLGQYLACITSVPSEKSLFLPCKCWEIMSAGSLLIACLGSAESIFQSLGFKPDIHYISCTNENITEKVNWVTDGANRKQVDTIRQAGHLLIQKHHLTSHRLAAIQDLITDL